MRKTHVSSLALIAILAAACTSAGSSASPAASPLGPRPRRSRPHRRSRHRRSPDACAKDNLALVTPGKLTIGTDNPAYPPYFAENADGTRPRPWESGDPTNGEGFESAVGYAIAERLGFDKADVAWIVVPFANSYAPGPKTFDFDLNQVTYKAERTQTADLSKGYYFGNQALVVLKDSPLAKATTDRRAQGRRLRRAGRDDELRRDRGRSSRRRRTPSSTTRTTSRSRRSATRPIDGVMVDLPTADFITNVQVENATIVGQFDGGHAGVLQRGPGQGQPADPCINAAIDVADRRTVRSTSWPAPGSRSRTPSRSSSRRVARPRRGAPATMTGAVRARAPRSGPARGALERDRDRQLGRRLRGSRLGRRQRPRLAGGPGVVLQRRGLLGVAAGAARGLRRQHPAVHDRRGPGPRVRAGPGDHAQPGRTGLPRRSGSCRRSTPTSSGRSRASSSSSSSASASRDSG